MAVGLAALLNTPFFAIFFVLVLQVSIPNGNASALLMTLLFAVSCHYFVSRPFHHRWPQLNMVATQQPRWDMKYVLPPWDTPPKHEEESDAPQGSAMEDVDGSDRFLDAEGTSITDDSGCDEDRNADVVSANQVRNEVEKA